MNLYESVNDQISTDLHLHVFLYSKTKNSYDRMTLLEYYEIDFKYAFEFVILCLEIQISKLHL